MSKAPTMSDDSKAIPTCVQASELRQGQYIKVLCPSIDALLNGGVRSGVITEFVGEGGSGKTHISLQLALTVQLPPTQGGLYGMAVYYSCDYNFPVRHIEAMKNYLNNHVACGVHKTSLDKVMVCKVATCDEFRFQLAQLEKLCAERSETSCHVRIVIIDSIASLFRSQFENNKLAMTERTKYFTNISKKLNQVVLTFNVAIVITNQVSDDFSGMTHTTNNQTLVSSAGQRIVPALGLAWANCIHNRIFLKICPGSNEGGSPRAMKILYSPYLPEGECEFKITKNGVE